MFSLRGGSPPSPSPLSHKRCLATGGGLPVARRGHTQAGRAGRRDGGGTRRAQRPRACTRRVQVSCAQTHTLARTEDGRVFSFGKGPTGHCACEGEGVPPGAAAEARSAPSPYPNFVPRLPHVMLIELRGPHLVPGLRGRRRSLLGGAHAAGATAASHGDVAAPCRHALRWA